MFWTKALVSFAQVVALLPDALIALLGLMLCSPLRCCFARVEALLPVALMLFCCGRAEMEPPLQSRCVSRVHLSYSVFCSVAGTEVLGLVSESFIDSVFVFDLVTLLRVLSLPP